MLKHMFVQRRVKVQLNYNEYMHAIKKNRFQILQYFKKTTLCFVSEGCCFIMNVFDVKKHTN